MIRAPQIQAFIEDHIVTMFGGIGRDKDNMIILFVLSYYDTYMLLALTKKNIMYLDDDIMRLIKDRKNKLYFRIRYDPSFDTYELKTIIYPASFNKCVRVVNDINFKLKQHKVGTKIDNTIKDKRSYTNINIESVASDYSQSHNIQL
jgi:hypothetical protein